MKIFVVTESACKVLINELNYMNIYLGHVTLAATGVNTHTEVIIAVATVQILLIGQQ